jgi:hypothetical protein
MSDIAAILGAGRQTKDDGLGAPSAAPSVFRARGGAVITQDTSLSTTKSKKKKISRELSALIGNGQHEILPPIVSVPVLRDSQG